MVEMASISGIDLGVDDNSFVSGAAFRLSNPARESVDITLSNGGAASIHEGRSYLVVRLQDRLPIGKLFVPAHNAAQGKRSD
jgi:hypothetical protein